MTMWLIQFRSLCACLVFLLGFIAATKFHYDKIEPCASPPPERFQKDLTEAEFKNFHLWGHHAPQRFSNDTLYGFGDAMTEIWNHQNPKSCKGKKFLISSGHAAGFGSIIHVVGSQLSMAMNMGRILLEHPIKGVQLPGDYWQSAYCKEHSKQNMECYYEPLSKCTIADADPNFVAEWTNDTETELIVNKHPEFINWREFVDEGKDSALEKIKDYPIVRMPKQAFKFEQYPQIFKPILDCHPGISPEYANTHNFMRFADQWWMSMSTAYIMRPNKATLAKVAELRARMKPPYPAEQGECVGIYVRHGDKGYEMSLIDTEHYLSASEFIWDRGLVHKRRLTARNHDHREDKSKTIFFGTEDPLALQEAVEWGKAKNWHVYYTDLFDRNDQAAAFKQGDGHQRGHDQLEFLSMFLNLDMTLDCSGWVCTSGSNWCRIVDELRVTVARKADLHSLDLSYKPCNTSFSNCFSADTIYDRHFPR